ncbi:MAG: AAA family ATPase [Gammaproteobacteria bacterium]|nr:AAA family ATPase [Gammaproteobacteria bacterium]
MTIPLQPDQLYTACNISQFDFETTDQLAELTEIIGQDRALQALHFGIGIQQQGYNLYVLGPIGLGKHTVVREYLQEQAAHKAAAADWCYINNFAKPQEPLAVRLDAGQAPVFSKDMLQLVEDLRSAIPSAFEAEEYHARVQEIENELKQTMETAFNQLADEAETHNITLIRTPHGFAFAPVHEKEVVSQKEFEKLPVKEQERIQQIIASLEDKLAAVLRQQPQWQREARNKVKALNQEVVMFAAGHLVDELKTKYLTNPVLQQYLDDVLQDVINNLDDFQHEEESGELMGIQLGEKAGFRRYAVNVLVSHVDHDGAPVVFADSPTYPNLVGAVEHTAQMGTLVTNFTLIKSGALHKANGGYLIIDIVKLLQQPYAWEGLKRALSSREIKIQSLAQVYSLISTVSLEPEPIPLDIKVVLIGDRMLYYLLHEYDPEFKQLFKVAADFDDRLPRTDDNQLVYARLIATLVRRNQLRPFHRDAVARVIEHSARIAEDAEKLSTEIMNVADLLREADHWAAMAQHPVVHREDIQKALDTQVYRQDRIREHLQEQITRGTLLIDTDGAKIGQINGLAVIELGDYAFATPTRITATARLGDGEVIDIEREVELGGATHSKGVFILSAFLGQRYAGNRPLSLSASLVFEQSYGQIDGDSASMAELCALLSTLADIPIKQNFAITGSVNQHGQAQAIGGVNEKIEGFFDICNARGLTGGQAVLIPDSNIKHLMLRHDVIDACRNKRFAIYAYNTVDEAIAILTGADAETINDRVEQRLIELEKYREEFSKAARTATESPDENE